MGCGIIVRVDGAWCLVAVKSKEPDMGGHSSGPSSYKIQKKQEEAEAKKQAEMKAAEQKAVDAANASAVGESSGGSGADEESVKGALSKARKKGATLAGEGAQTFGQNGNLGA